MTAPERSNRDRYECEARSSVETEMIERFEPEFDMTETPKIFQRNVLSCRSLKCLKSKSKCLRHISFNRKLSISVISLQTLAQTSQSYQSQRWTLRLTHIGLYWIGLQQSHAVLMMEYSWCMMRLKVTNGTSINDRIYRIDSHPIVTGLKRLPRTPLYNLTN